MLNQTYSKFSLIMNFILIKIIYIILINFIIVKFYNIFKKFKTRFLIQFYYKLKVEWNQSNTKRSQF